MHSNKLLYTYVLGKIMINMSSVTYIWNSITEKKTEIEKNKKKKNKLKLLSPALQL